MTDELYRIERDSKGHAHIVRDPNGQPRWELSGKWQSKPGRKPEGKAPRVSRTYRLPAELVNWLAAQPGGANRTIERLIREAMNQPPSRD